MRFSNLGLRVLVAVFGIPFYVFVLYHGGLFFFFTNLLIVILATYEFLSLSDNRPNVTWVITMAISAYCFWMMYQGKTYEAGCTAVIPFLVILFIHVVSGKPAGALLHASRSAAAVLYIAWLFGHLFILRDARGSLQHWSTPGWQLALFPVAVTWFTDTCAYVVGLTIGKTPFAPGISPKKTWEGAIGGFLGAVTVGIIAGTMGVVSVPVGLIIGLFAGSVGQLGDLGESLLKREFGQKDSSSIIPGHGGVLDRFDSLLLNVPGTVYILLLLVHRSF